MTKPQFLGVLAALSVVAALALNLAFSGEALSAGLIASSLGSAAVFWALSAIPLAFQRGRPLSMWPSLLVWAAIVGLNVIGRLSVAGYLPG